MKEMVLQTKVKVCHYDELAALDKEVVDAAREATSNSYAVYSGFNVGAAVRLESGVIVKGSNQENAAYPSGLCAERTTLFAANANHPHTPVLALAVACYTNGHFTKEPASPCGACRQVMLETEYRFQTPMKVILYGDDECYIFHRASDLLPVNFVADNLQG